MGAGAYGYVEVTADVTKYTKADLEYDARVAEGLGFRKGK